MRMRGSSSSFPASLASPDAYSQGGFAHFQQPSFSSIKEMEDLSGSPTNSAAFRGISITDGKFYAVIQVLNKVCEIVNKQDAALFASKITDGVWLSLIACCQIGLSSLPN